MQEVPDLTPADDEILIQVKASGLNFADILARKGQYQDGPDKPCVMGYEVSGIVSDVGSSVDNEWIGKEVLAITRFKGQAEQVVVKENQAHEKPERLSFEEAATLPVNYMTAWALVVVMGGLRKNESFLIHNAGGGMGLAQLDIASHIGATTYGTSSPRKHDFLHERGLDHAIDYRNNGWACMASRQPVPVPAADSKPHSTSSKPSSGCRFTTRFHSSARTTACTA